jgi:hypothetical protein
VAPDHLLADVLYSQALCYMKITDYDMVIDTLTAVVDLGVERFVAPSLYYRGKCLMLREKWELV